MTKAMAAAWSITLFAGGCTLAHGPDDGGRPSCRLTYEFVTSPEFRPPNEYMRLSGAPPAPGYPMGYSQAVQPQTGRVGLASWWIAEDDAPLVTLAITFGSELRDGGTTLRIWAVLNGALVELRRSDDGDAAWGLSTAVSLGGRSSIFVPLELKSTDLRPGLNTLAFIWELPTPDQTPRLWDGSSPVLNVFFERTGTAEIRSDNDAVSAQVAPRVAGGATVVSRGPNYVGAVAFLDHPNLDELESAGLFVHAQVDDAAAECIDASRTAFFVLLDGEPLPIGPAGQTSLILEIPSDSMVTAQLRLPPLPRSPGHALEVWKVGGIGYPYESDQNTVSDWYDHGGGLAQIFW